MHRWLGAALTLACLDATMARALPDLVPEVDSIAIEHDQSVSAGDVTEGCAGATSGRTLLRFGVRFHNVGDESLVIGDPLCPDCDTNPGAVCADPRFICSPADGHGHPHYANFARYQLLDMEGAVVAEGRKISFCVRETACPVGTRIIYDCENQGIQPGCYDHYDATLGCQYIDVTDVPNVEARAFRLRVTLDPDATLPDADRSNNALEELIPGCGDGVADPGEECDGTPCCSESCALLEDCGPGHLPCLSLRCTDAGCVEVPVPGYCVIDDSCITAGAVSPDGCGTCQPSQAADAWTPAFSPDAQGLRCRLGALATESGSCRRQVARQLVRRLGRVERLLERLEQRGQAVDGKRFDRATRRLVAFSTRRDCAATGAAGLREQAMLYLDARLANGNGGRRP